MTDSPKDPEANQVPNVPGRMPPKANAAQLGGLVDLAMKQAVMQREERRQALNFAIQIAEFNGETIQADNVLLNARTFAEFLSEG